MEELRYKTVEFLVDAFMTLRPAAIIALVLTFFVFFPMAAIRPTRVLAGRLINGASKVFGLVTWLYCAGFTLFYFGWTALVIGVLVVGVGVVPIAIFGAIWNGEWSWALFLVVALVGIYGLRFFGIYIKTTAIEEMGGEE